MVGSPHPLIEPAISYRMIGVYGGRMTGARARLGDMELGYGWYRSMIDRVLAEISTWRLDGAEV